MFVKSIVTASLIASAATCVALAADSSQYGAAQSAPAKPAAPAAPAAKLVTIVQTAKNAGSFNTLCDLLTKANLVDTLNGTTMFTVFAPTDAAFAKLPPETLAALAKDPKALANILTYHVVSGKVPAAEVVKLKEVATVEGQPIKITIVEGKVMLNNGATVTATDIGASNGMIHVIDTVLMPPAKKAATDVKPSGNAGSTAK